MIAPGFPVFLSESLVEESMRSRTKYDIDGDTITRLFAKAGFDGAQNISPQGAGEYNSVYSVDAAGKAFAIKIAPQESARIITYEQQMMEQEFDYCALIANQIRIKVPEIYYSEFSRSEIPSDHFLMARIEGQQLYQAE